MGFLGFLFFFALLNGGDIRFLGMVFGFYKGLGVVLRVGLF